jgi:hypothetical protein
MAPGRTITQCVTVGVILSMLTSVVVRAWGPGGTILVPLNCGPVVKACTAAAFSNTEVCHGTTCRNLQAYKQHAVLHHL